MSTAQFQIKFDGEGLRAGTMDVRSLAPSLLAIADLIDESNRVINQNRASVSLKVRGDFEASSFESTLELTLSFYEQTRALLLGSDVQDAKELLQTIGVLGGSALGVRSLLGLLKKIRGRKPKRVRLEKQSGAESKAIIELEGEDVETSKPVADLYNDIKVLQAAREIARPLDEQGIDVLELGEKTGGRQRIDKSDLPALEAPLAEVGEETLLDSTYRRVFGVVRPSFSEDYVWTLSDGENNIRVTMSDTAFLKEVESGAPAFSSGSLIEADVSSVTSRTPTGKLTTRSTINKVHRVIPPSRQTRFDFGSTE